LLIFTETIAILFISYLIYKYVFVSHVINIQKPIAIVVLVVLFFVLPSQIKAMFILLAITAFAAWLAYFIEYNNSQSRWMLFIRKWF